MKLAPGTPLAVGLLSNEKFPPRSVGRLAMASGLAQLEWSAEAIAEGVKFLICDTAGRIHTRHNLMEELAEIARAYKPHGFYIDGLLPENKVAAAALINQNVEAIVRRFPAQYLWSYNRYKRPGGAPPPEGETAA